MQSTLPLLIVDTRVLTEDEPIPGILGNVHRDKFIKTGDVFWGMIFPMDKFSWDKSDPLVQACS
jgi:hypothetical protein